MKGGCHGLFPLIFILSLFPGRGKTLHLYVTLLLWLTLWTVGDSILNYIASVWAQKELGIVDGNYNLMYLTALAYYTGKQVAVAGSMHWLVPTLSLALIKGSEMAFVAMAGKVGGTVQSVASSTGAKVSSEAGLQSLERQGIESEKRTIR